jgi:hypothetical protein
MDGEWAQIRQGASWAQAQASITQNMSATGPHPWASYSSEEAQI